MQVWNPICLSGALGLLALGLAADEKATVFQLLLEPDRTAVRFTLEAVAHTVHGTATVRSGELIVTTAGGAVTGEIVVDARTAETGRRKRDRDMHVKVLNSEDFPEIVFVAEKYEVEFDPAGVSALTLRGRLRIHGDEHPLSIPVTVESQAGHWIARGHFDVPYVEWGMRDPSFFVLRVDKTVAVEIEAHGTIKEWHDSNPRDAIEPD